MQNVNANKERKGTVNKFYVDIYKKINQINT